MPIPDSGTAHQALILLEDLRARLAAVERLIAPKPVASPPEGDVMVLVVEVQGVNVAFPVESVEEVVPYAWLTPIPQAPPWVAGVLDLGGRMICVLDVAARVTGAPHHPRRESFIVICRVEQRRVGLCVDAVQRVATFPSAAVAPPPLDVPYGPYLAATISNAGSPILLLSVELLLYTSDVPLVPEVCP